MYMHVCIYMYMYLCTYVSSLYKYICGVYVCMGTYMYICVQGKRLKTEQAGEKFLFVSESVHVRVDVPL